MKRGDLVTVVMPGAYGKPRPAVIVQSDIFGDLESVTFLPFTTEILVNRTSRVIIDATPGNGLQGQSQAMADKCSTLPKSKVGAVFGTLAPDDMGRVERALAVFLGFA